MALCAAARCSGGLLGQRVAAAPRLLGRSMSGVSSQGHERRSFIEVAKLEGMEALLNQPFPNKGGYDAAFSGTLEVVSVEAPDSDLPRAKRPARAVATLTVTDELANAYGTLHGGAVASLVDILGTMALLAADRSKPGVSVEINVSYVAAAAVGSRLVATGEALRVGRTMGFTEVSLRDEETGRLVAVGRHTKAFPSSS